MHERREEEQRYAYEQCDVCNVVREHLHVDEIDHTSVEPAITTEDPVNEVPKRAAEHEAEGDSFDTSGCVAKDNHDRDDDADCNNRENRTLIGEDREACARVEGEPELEDTLDNNDGRISERVDSPCLGQLVDRRNNDADDNSELSVAQPRCAASTVVVAYGIASSRASGIGSPVTSHIPYRPFSIRS